MQPDTITDAEIAELAHSIWEEEGKPHGRHEIHWQRALDMLTEAKSEPKKSKKAKAKKPAKGKAKAKTAGIKDDISLIGGVGPKIKKQLAGTGITSLEQIAALSDDEMSDLDEHLGLRGRSVREEWTEQARELMAGKPPRAKTDRARA